MGGGVNNMMHQIKTFENNSSPTTSKHHILLLQNYQYSLHAPLLYQIDYDIKGEIFFKLQPYPYDV